LAQLVATVGEALLRQNAMLVTTESCTGGWVAQACTAVPGSSRWFERGFVVYSNAAKEEMLGVSAAILARDGAVSEAAVRAMAEGALTHSRAQVAVAVTGIAGPDGGTPDKPVGTVWFAWTGTRRETLSRRHQLNGDREAVRRQSVVIALEGLRDYLA